MLPKNYRLKKKSAFTATYRTLHSYHENGITVFCGKINKNNTPTKIGFVVSKKIHKRAVKRNRIKRLMRESCRIIIKNNNIENKYISLIFVASKKLLTKNYEQINTTILNLVQKI